MSAVDAIIEHGKRLVHSGLCPACEVQGKDQALQPDPPDGFHWHGNESFHAYLFCPVDGQGYRIDGDDLRILPACNGGIHPGDFDRRFA